MLIMLAQLRCDLYHVVKKFSWKLYVCSFHGAPTFVNIINLQLIIHKIDFILLLKIRSSHRKVEVLLLTIFLINDDISVSSRSRFISAVGINADCS